MMAGTCLSDNVAPAPAEVLSVIGEFLTRNVYIITVGLNKPSDGDDPVGWLPLSSWQIALPQDGFYPVISCGYDDRMPTRRVYDILLIRFRHRV